MRKFTKTGESRTAFFGRVRKKLTRSVEFLLAAAMLVGLYLTFVLLDVINAVQKVADECCTLLFAE